MEEVLQLCQQAPFWVKLVVILLAIWELVWKLLGMWKSARNNHPVWFICIAILNTLGVLPIIYILMHRGSES